MKKYQIADFIFGIHMEESLEIPENFKKFFRPPFRDKESPYHITEM